MPRRLQPLHTGWRSEKPLPTVPASPTLTNPDMVLPDGMPNMPSPPRWVRRPPSPSYLRDVNSESPEPRPSQDGPGHKMMLLRNRSPNMGAGAYRGAPMQSHMDSDGFIASSPILRDTANSTPEPSLHLQPPRGIEGSQSGSSSSEAEGLANFLAKYEQLGNGTASDEDGHDTDAYEKRPQTSYELKSDVDAQRKKQQEEEQNSAILSQRAEQILANAKKRLNVMEGNLRGARDLLPLTAANLKRATSLGSNHHYTASYSRDQFIQSGYGYDPASGSGQRTLRGKASSPTMGHEFVNHARGFSVNELPDRPHTSFDNPPDVMAQNIQRVSKTPEPTSSALRSSKSYEVLSQFGYAPHSGARERSMRTPDSGYLEPLHEDEELRRSARNTRLSTSQSSRYDNISRPSSRASSIREQLTSLKGRIESMKERAREDNLRRQSMQDLRNSPFNNATTAAPEFYYNVPAAGESQVDAPAHGGGSWFAETDEVETPATSSLLASPWENGRVVPESRNAFAEQMAAENLRNQVHHGLDRTATRTPNSLRQQRSHTNLSSSSNERIRDLTAAEPKVLRSFLQDEDVLNQPFPPLPSVAAPDAAQHSSSESSGDVDSDNYAPSVSETSFYEEATHDAPAEPSPTGIVAHEDRADAFDYENFFLQSAMARYTPGPGPERRGSDAGSDASSASSTETARGPSAAHEVDEDSFEPDSDLFPPPTPETPERLRQIEYNLHQRTRSTETVETFATAYEGDGSPLAYGGARANYLGDPLDDRRPTPSPQLPPQSRKQAGSRPSTAVQQQASRPPVRRSSSSDRADSGVGLNQRLAHGSLEEDAKRPRAATVTRAASSSSHRYAGSSAVTTTPPRSPLQSSMPPPPAPPPLLDPAILAVNALLDPNGKQLGLRSKAVLFSVVESLRKVALRLQEEDEAQYESRVLRRRLDDAKNALDGVL